MVLEYLILDLGPRNVPRGTSYGVHMENYLLYGKDAIYQNFFLCIQISLPVWHTELTFEKSEIPMSTCFPVVQCMSKIIKLLFCDSQAL